MPSTRFSVWLDLLLTEDSGQLYGGPSETPTEKSQNQETGPGKEGTVTPFSLHIKCPNFATCPTGAQVPLKNVKQEDASRALGLADWRHRLPEHQTLQEALV